MNAREGVAKNALVRARESRARGADHKAVIRKFLQRYEQRSGVPDDRYGYLKYKALLLQAVNQKIETIHIDLDDLEDFCRKEVQNEDAQLNVQSAEALEKIIDDIESNTMRYMKYFYDACDLEQPEQDKLPDGSAALARDAINRWRKRTWEERQDGSGADALPIPAKMRNNWEVRFRPRTAGKIMKMREITSPYVGSLVQIDCLVVRIAQVKPKVEVVTYTCEVCGAEIFLSVEGEHYTPPKECPSQKCKDNKQAGKLNSNVRTCKFVRHQELRVQEMSEHVPVGGVPRTINAICYGDLTRKVLPGDAITLTGVYTPYQLPWYQAMVKGPTMQEMFIEAHHIKKHKHGYRETGASATEDEQEQKISEEADKGDMYERLAKSIAPEIFGNLDVKKALLLALVGSFTKTMQDGMKIRGDIHTLLMGDPGVAKSQLLKQACTIAPRSVYTTGKGSSGVGLTAAVVRDSLTGEVSLEGGALVLADMGVCCIDEFDKMEEADRTAIHEVMEQQSVSIAKAGITTSLNCRTTILAGANPYYGRYNPYKSPVENIDLPAALLSRFDLLFLLLDTVDVDRDKQLANHVCKVHSSYGRKSDPDAQQPNQDAKSQEGDVLNLGFVPFDGNFLRAFIRRARKLEPLVEDSLMPQIVDAYVSMRDDEKRSEVDSRKSYTTPRTLLALLRLSQAHARTRFSTRVELQDFQEAMRLMKASKESVELSSPARRDANPLDIIHDIVADLSRRLKPEDDGWVELQHLVSMAGHKALNQEQCIEAIDNWVSLNILSWNPEKTMVKFMVPPA